ncbi:MAG: acyltransferase [Cocleimonas sp.]
MAIWDGWRGMAIILLLMGHFFHIPWIWEDRLGVDAFFVLSGMLMSTILFEKRVPLKTFYIRRFSRIFPVFSLYIIVAFVFAYVAKTYLGRSEMTFEMKEFFSTLTFFRTYFPADPHIWVTQVPIGHLWSLNVEEHAYVLMSIITLFIFRNQKVAILLIAFGLGAVALSFYYYFNPAIAPTEFRIRTETAISFVFLSAGYNLIKKQFNIVVPSLLPVITLVLAFMCYLEDPSISGRSLLFPWLSFSLAPLLLAFTLNHITEIHTLFRKAFELKAIRLMGTWSFSIYLWQQLFYSYKWLIPFAPIGGIVISIITGALSFYLFENPVRRWINNRWT